MMSCRQVADLSSQYLERELSLVRRVALRMHLFLCRECRALVDGVRRVLQASPLLRRSGDHRRYEDLADRLTSDPDGAPRDTSD